MKDTQLDPTKAVPENAAQPGRFDPPPLPPEVGGAPGPEPTRYGDWQHKGRCTDF
jgi:hypothetical protein